jgi:hypothetical protein
MAYKQEKSNNFAITQVIDTGINLIRESSNFLHYNHRFNFLNKELQEQGASFQENWSINKWAIK